MNYYKSKTYLDDLRCAVKNTINIEKIYNSSILITGASGLIGSFIIDALMLCNKEYGANITIYAIGRSIRRLEERFDFIKNDNLIFVEHDVNSVPQFYYQIDYIIHAASPAYPAAFNNTPVDTIMSNILGTKYLLDYGREHNIKRFLFVSSGEVYGQGDLSLSSFSEDYAGYVDSTSTRSCYPNAKRAAETLCVSYTKQYGVDTVIARPSHTYGPTATQSDNRANVQFVNSAIAGHDIVLNSVGNQLRSYTYIADTASAILTILMVGESCNAYNIANPQSITTIAGFAQEVATHTGVKVVFSNPDEVAKKEMSPVAKQVLSSEKLYRLGWNAEYTISKGIENTMSILRTSEII